MNESYIRNAIEAALLAAGKPLQLPELTQIFDENVRPKAEEIRAALEVLAVEYSSRGIEIKETAAGFRIQVRREFASEVSRLWPERPARYSRALLETLALIAYRQPITRAEIEAVRGVAVNPNILKTVIERNWVRVVGHRDVPGHPELLGTTREFLDYFGLKSLDELPPLAELKAVGDIKLQLELPSAADAGSDSVGAGAASDGSAAVAPSDAVAAVAAGEGAVAGDGATAVAAGDDPAAHAEVADGAAAIAAEGAAAASDDGAAVGTIEGAAGDGTPPVTADSEVDNLLSADESAAPNASDGGHDSSKPVGEREAATAEDAEGVSGSARDDSGDVFGDAASDEDAEDDELSADGNGSRELVAAPRDLGD